jgi:hypothetical protein
MAQKAKTTKKDLKTPSASLLDDAILSAPIEKSLDEVLSEPDFGIPDAVITESEINSAHMNALDLSVPANIKRAYMSKGWELKWIRYIKPNGEFDHQQIAKYTVLLGGNFVSIKQLAAVDPVYAATMSQSRYQGGQVGSGEQDVITREDLALVMYKAAIAQRIRLENSKKTMTALTAGERKAKEDGLDVQKFSSD